MRVLQRDYVFLLELHVRHKISSALDAFRKEHIPCGSNSDNMGVFAERLERYGVMDLARGLAGVVERYEVGRLQGFLSDRIDVPMLS